MLSTVTFKHIKSSQDISDYATRKLSKLNKYKDFKLIEARYIFSTERENSIHIAELILKIKNDKISAKSQEKSMYHAIDNVVTKVSKQLAKKKNTPQSTSTTSHVISKDKKEENLESDEESQPKED